MSLVEGPQGEGKPEGKNTSPPSAPSKSDPKRRPQQLYGEVIPEFIHKSGDVKSGRVAKWMVEQYLDRYTLIFNRELLREMFEEADFRKEGSLDERALAAALSGRYPKRHLTEAWRQLVALIFDIPELVLQEDVVVPKVAKGTFNSENIWDTPAPPLPRIGKRGEVKSCAATGELNNMAAAASATANLGVDTFSALDASSPLKFLEEGLQGSATLTGSSAAGTSLRSVNQTLLSSRGVEVVGPTEEEMSIYRALLQGGENGVPRSTFSTVREFNRFADGHDVKAQAAAEANFWSSGMGRSMLIQSMGDGGATTSYSANGCSLPSIRSNSMRKGSSMKTSGSALQTLRTSIMKGAYQIKPEFEATTRSLTTNDMDRLKTLGRKIDISQSIARVEPTRPTSLRYQDDYVAVGDYAANCRTAPTQWDLHPRAPAEAKEPCKYPWGNLG